MEVMAPAPRVVLRGDPPAAVNTHSRRLTCQRLRRGGGGAKPPWASAFWSFHARSLSSAVPPAPVASPPLFVIALFVIARQTCVADRRECQQVPIHTKNRRAVQAARVLAVEGGGEL